MPQREENHGTSLGWMYYCNIRSQLQIGTLLCCAKSSTIQNPMWDGNSRVHDTNTRASRRTADAAFCSRSPPKARMILPKQTGHHRTPRPLAILHVLLGTYHGSATHPTLGSGDSFSPDQSIRAVESASNGQTVRHSTQNGLTRGIAGNTEGAWYKARQVLLPILHHPLPPTTFLLLLYILSISQHGCWGQASQHLHVQEERK